MTDLSDEVAAGKVLDFDKAVPMCSDEGWRDRLIMSKGRDGSLKVASNEANAITVLVNHEAWDGVIAFDEFRNNVCFMHEPPWHPDDAPIDGSFEGGQMLTDTDLTRLQAWFQRFEYMGLGVDRVGRVIHAASEKASFHPVKAYLDGLAWDGVARVARWLETYCGVIHDPYIERVGTWWLVSAVARVMEPGCKADHILVLEGPQGIGKSTAFKNLLPDEGWWCDSELEIGSKDAYQKLQGRWLVELAELDGVTRRKEVTQLKAFITNATDKYRPPYGRVTVEVPRSCVFCGTVNESQYLKDSTGNRRFWPARAGRVQPELVARDRDQLWAETLRLYHAGQHWWPQTAEDIALCETEQAARVQVDDRVDKVIEWLEGRVTKSGRLVERGTYPFTTIEVIEGVMGVTQTSEQSRRLQMEVAGMLRSQGYEKGDLETIDGVRSRFWRKVK